MNKRWVSTLNNAKKQALDKAFSDNEAAKELNKIQKPFESLVKNILIKLKRQDSNDFCCDCNALGADWLVTNLGVFVCIECCGVHREMGVHISKTQSTKIDRLTTSQLIVRHSFIIKTTSLWLNNNCLFF